ncbi:hypothetical protein SIN8267_03515 [Sinobacterium norvegicum]|uniref:Sulfotransferase n=1 Tax=Sinobacterium norvegicum TaxID=1641715 RepID=A0ABN8EQP2_9GAMM|nr:sulfotransferase [Sinobacterium norvegicum]CAH0993367.1 hypothetical protein SIN8267_03515 [Sinobacterium norvegicum]
MAISQFIPLPVFKKLLKENKTSERSQKRLKSRLKFSRFIEPIRWYENIRYRGLMAKTELKQDPVFLLGFGRSGTTHLHYLFWQDPQFGVLSNYQATMQPIALTGRGWLAKLLANSMPSTRPMDNVAMSMDAPQEEELALVNISEHASLHFMSFPQNLDVYDRYVTQLGSNQKQLKAWQAGYMQVVKKATILNNGRRLALKTPSNTGRIKVLNSMFPDAKYVNIVRNPYRVYQSMLNMYRKVLPSEALQEIDWQAIDAWVLEAYKATMNSYLEQRQLIPKDNLVEIKYEQLDETPLPILEAIYQQLDLGDFNAVKPKFEDYLNNLGTFEKNQFDFPEHVINTVNEHWGFAFDAFGYEKIEAGETLTEASQQG